MPRDLIAEAALVGSLRAALAGAADPERAVRMQAYMKSSMPFRGISAPELTVIARRQLAAHPLPDAASWREAVFELWHGAEFREERYAALALLAATPYRAYRTLDALSLYEELIVTGAWWDLVDGIATHRLRELLEAQSERMGVVLRGWAGDRNLWKRRSAIICQVGRRSATDGDLLLACIEPNLGDRDFFIRKAIGWALREYGKANPDVVRHYVAENESRLSGLSRREALRRLA